MMPIVIVDPRSIPEEYLQYLPLLKACRGFTDRVEMGQIGYLTVQESLVSKGQSQRRPCLHTETPGLVTVSGGRIETIEVGWGGGEFVCHKLCGGIYMASTISGSCRVWNAQIRNPSEVVGPHGDIEHVREFLGDGKSLE